MSAIIESESQFATPASSAVVASTGWRRFVRRNPRVMVPAILLLLIVVTVVILPLVLTSPTATDPIHRLLGPSAKHLLGTDEYGRDEFSRLVSGGRVSLGMGLLITVCSGTIGTALGLISGFFTKAGNVIMRITDAWMAFPAIVLAMIFSVVIGPGVVTELLAIGLIFIPFSARVLRSRTLEVTNRTFVEAARVSGMGRWKILLVHVFPNVLPLIIVQTIIYVASTMLIDGGLSFLGLGVAPPTSSWGNMIADARSYMTQEPSLLVYPGIVLACTVFLVNMLGTNLRPVFDPQARALGELQRLRTRGNQLERMRRR